MGPFVRGGSGLKRSAAGVKVQRILWGYKIMCPPLDQNLICSGSDVRLAEVFADGVVKNK